MDGSSFSAAFLIGLFGGLHCVGMCGGIVAAVTLGGKKAWWPGITAYQLARISTYALLGLVAGFVGGAIAGAPWLTGGQKALSVFAGLVMVLFALQLGGWVPEHWGPLNKIRISPSMLRRTREERSLKPWLPLGVINGLLPCGLVYTALAVSLPSGGPVQGAAIMLAFGLGTLPWMFGFAGMVSLITPRVRGILLKAGAGALILFGLFMIIKVTPLFPGHTHHNGDRMEQGTGTEGNAHHPDH